jgi:hypothetical protein
MAVHHQSTSHKVRMKRMMLRREAVVAYIVKKKDACRVTSMVEG